MVRGSGNASESLDALRSMGITSSYGGTVPLSSVAEVSIEQAPQTINRTNQSRQVEITGDTAQTYVIPFSDFKLPDYLEGESIAMDLSSVTVFQLTVSGEGEYAGSHSFNVDDIIVTTAS